MEVLTAVWKKRYSNTAPGLDGVRSVVWRKAPRAMMLKLAECFTVCLKEDVFPKAWKRAGLVLIPKAGRDISVRPVKARPICLLSVTGKMFERVIVERILNWMVDHPAARLSDNQFGFRQGRSTYDALLRFKGIVEDTVSDGGLVIAVSLDVANAFNSIPFQQILAALGSGGFPAYLVDIIRSYLNDRVVEYPVGDGRLARRAVCAGVPQGSVLGPLLWNITYNEVLET